MPDNQISSDKKEPEIKYAYAIGDIVVTREPVCTFCNGLRKGTALVGWKWKVHRYIKGKPRQKIYLLSDASEMYWCEVKEYRIWKKWDQLTPEQQETAKLGKEIKVK